MQETATIKTPWFVYRRITTRNQLLIAIGIILAAGLIEFAMGRLPISKSGKIFFWEGDIHSSELSQQIADWYSFSHILHGFILYGVFFLLNRKRWSPGFSLLLAISLEAAWEIFENTPYCINRYRAMTASQGYTGDTILNSMSDILFCILGYIIARHLPLWLTILILLVIEIGLALAIRDNLTLNILMLIHPIQAIKQWQLGV